MIRKPVIACFFFVALSLSVTLPTERLAAQNGKVTEAGMAFQDQNFEETIDLAKKALEKPELLSPKNVAKANSLLAQAMVMLYLKIDKAPDPKTTEKNPEAQKTYEAKKAKFDSKYPNALQDAQKALAAVQSSSEGAAYEKDVAPARQNLAQIHIAKLQNMVSDRSTDFNAQLKHAADAEEILKPLKNSPTLFWLVLYYLRGNVYAQQSEAQNGNETIARNALADFKRTIDLFKTGKFEVKEQMPIVEQTASGAYANAISLSMKVDKPAVKALIDEAKVKFPNDKAIEDLALQNQISGGNADESERALADAIQKDPKNIQKRLVYASLLEKRYEAGVKAKKPAAEIETDYNKVVQAYKDALAIEPEREEANFNLGAIYFNKAVEYNKMLNDLPDDASDAKTNALTKKKKEFMALALPHFEKAAEKNKYSDENALSTLITITMELEMADKTKLYTEKKKSAKR